MKKLLPIGLLILTSCLSPPGGTSVTPEPVFTPEATTTRIPPTGAPVSSPQGATATPTIVLPPTVTATSLPPERYFIEEFYTPLTHWSTLYASGDTSRVDILNKDGTLTFELYTPNAWIYAIYGAFEYDSVHLETWVESHGSNINAVGLVCHYDEQAGWYEFNISSDGAYNVLYGQWLAEGVARYTPILSDTSERIETGNAANEVGLDCYENIVQLYINDKLIRKLNVEHIGLTDGKVGLALASFDEVPVILSYDWVKVSEP